MNTNLKRRPSEVLKRGYSDEEIDHLYELARFFLENGEIRKANILLDGITQVAPDFAYGWLALSYVHIQAEEYDQAIYSARQALRVNPECLPAESYLIACYLTTGDTNSAGTLLGEVGEKIESGLVENPFCVRFYKAQLARFSGR